MGSYSYKTGYKTANQMYMSNIIVSYIFKCFLARTNYSLHKTLLLVKYVACKSRFHTITWDMTQYNFPNSSADHA